MCVRSSFVLNGSLSEVYRCRRMVTYSCRACRGCWELANIFGVSILGGFTLCISWRVTEFNLASVDVSRLFMCAGPVGQTVQRHPDPNRPPNLPPLPFVDC